MSTDSFPLVVIGHFSPATKAPGPIGVRYVCVDRQEEDRRSPRLRQWEERKDIAAEMLNKPGDVQWFDSFPEALTAAAVLVTEYELPEGNFVQINYPPGRKPRA